ncbi:MAG: hypothetical protein ACHQF4_08105 [Sphingobacteriales bacterium]
MAMVDVVVAAVNEYVYVYACCDACNNDAYGQKVLAGAVAAVAIVAIMLLAQLTPLLLPLLAVRYPLIEEQPMRFLNIS